MSAPHARRWPASLAVALVVVLQVVSPDQVVPSWWPALVTLEVLLLVPLVAANPLRLRYDAPWHRMTGVVLAVVLLAANAVRLAQLVVLLLEGGAMRADELIGGGALIWLTNVVVTAVALWELDQGGPFARDPGSARDQTGWNAAEWRPSFLDYLFVAFTAATAFSPTDTMPLSHRAKLLFVLAASVSLLTIAVVAARAVNVL
jgi:uncharacterized membrane protein